MSVSGGFEDNLQGKDVEDKAKQSTERDDAWSNLAADGYDEAGAGLGNLVKSCAADTLPKLDFDNKIDSGIDLKLADRDSGMNWAGLKDIDPGLGKDPFPIRGPIGDSPAIEPKPDDPDWSAILKKSGFDEDPFSFRQPAEDPDDRLPIDAYADYLTTGKLPAGWHLNPYGNEPGAHRFIKDAQPEPLPTITIGDDGRLQEGPPKGYMRNPYGNEPGAPRWVKDKPGFQGPALE
jgi:hypothetical protein